MIRLYFFNDASWVPLGTFPRVGIGDVIGRFERQGYRIHAVELAHDREDLGRATVEGVGAGETAC